MEALALAGDSPPLVPQTAEEFVWRARQESAERMISDVVWPTTSWPAVGGVICLAGRTV